MSQFDRELTGEYPAGVVVNVADYNRAVRAIKERDKLLKAAKYACGIIGEERAGGSLESDKNMLEAQRQLYDATRTADPLFYGFKA